MFSCCLLDTSICERSSVAERSGQNRPCLQLDERRFLALLVRSSIRQACLARPSTSILSARSIEQFGRGRTGLPALLSIAKLRQTLLPGICRHSILVRRTSMMLYYSCSSVSHISTVPGMLLHDIQSNDTIRGHRWFQRLIFLRTRYIIPGTTLLCRNVRADCIQHYYYTI